MWFGAGSATWGDIDNDGFPDLYTTNVFGGEEFLFKNSTGTLLTNIIEESGLPSGIFGHSSAFGDMENDGDLDLFVSSFEEDRLYVFENNLDKIHATNWISFDLIDTESNSSAIGAKIKVAAGDLVQIREKSCGDSYLSQQSPYVHFGLGEKTIIDS